MKLKVYSKKWGKLPVTKVDVKYKASVAGGRIKEVRQPFFTSKVPGMSQTGTKGS